MQKEEVVHGLHVILEPGDATHYEWITLPDKYGNHIVAMLSPYQVTLIVPGFHLDNPPDSLDDHRIGYLMGKIDKRGGSVQHTLVVILRAMSAIANGGNAEETVREWLHK